MQKFSFNKSTHQYFLHEGGNNIQIPSVTSVLPYSFFGNDTEYSRERGQFVHDMIYLYNMNDLNEDTLDPVLTPYLEAYKKFIVDMSLPIGYTYEND